MKKLVLTLMAGMFGLGAFAQDFTITGTITETGSGNPVPNHIVYIYTDSLVLPFFGTSTTDASGNYSMIIPNGGQVGPNLMIWVNTDSCNSYAYRTLENLQGTVTSATVDFQVCGSPAGGGGGACDASFSWQDSANTGYIYFHANNMNANVTYSWSFGDGSSSTLSDPVHYYSNPGMYYVCLTIDSAGACTNTYCDTVVIGNGGSGMCLADFWWYADSLNNTVYIVNNSSWSATMSYDWDFGDGNVGTGQYPTHTYANYGTYNVCLTISDGPACSDTYCASITFLPFMSGQNRSGFTLNVIAPTAMGVEEEQASFTEVNVYPNPASEMLNIQLSSEVNGKAEIVVTDMLGKVVKNDQYNIMNGNNNFMMNVASFEAGMYVISVRDINTGKSHSIRFVRQ